MGLIKTTVYCDPLRGILYVFGVVAVFVGAPAATQADVVRIATYDADLTAKGPGLLLRDIAGTGSPRLRTTLSLLTQAAPDILLLVGVDYDYYLTALSGLRDRLQARGLDYPYLFAKRPNSGMATGFDLDGDGRRRGAGDAQGFGYFSGAGGLAILSKFPILLERVIDFSAVLWADLPGSLIGGLDLSPAIVKVQRLSSTGHWAVPIRLGDGAVLTLLVFAATPPVFDGPEDRNGRRNRDEIRFWQLYLDGHFGTPPVGDFVVMGKANLDPFDGEGRHGAMRELLADRRLQDPAPRSAYGRRVSNPDHRGDPALDTADWSDPVPGNLRVDYVLPSAGLTIVGSGVVWPQAADRVAASHHGLVWVDLDIP
jgi:hypothetical protein